MLTETQRTRILSAIADYDRFIIKEQRRNPELRPAKVQKILEDYLKIRAELQTALDIDSADCLTFPGESK